MRLGPGLTHVPLWGPLRRCVVGMGRHVGACGVIGGQVAQGQEQRCPRRPGGWSCQPVLQRKGLELVLVTTEPPP